MKNFFKLLMVLLCTGTYCLAQSPAATTPSTESLTQPLQSFNRLQVGPHINVVLQEGASEQIRLDYAGVDPEKIKWEVRGNRLSIYLEGAKRVGKTERIERDGMVQKVPYYRDAQVTAYVTYTGLKSIEVRGEEKVSCEGPLVSNKFKIRLFGESQLDLASLQAQQVNVRLFGENTLAIHAGDSPIQSYRLYGENKVNTENMAAQSISSSSFGENQLTLATSEQISLWSVGTIQMNYAGDPQLRRFVLGDATINSR